MEALNGVKLRVEEVGLYFGQLRALDGVSLEVRGTEILAVIGPNGAGKSCLLNCINGFYRPQQGDIYFENKNITRLPPHKIAEMGISRTFQNIELYTGLTVLDNLMAARHIRMKTGALAGAFYFGPAYREEIEHRKVVEDIIDFLEMEPIRKKVVGLLPYGMRKRVEFGRALALEPKLLLLDEPSLGLSPILVGEIFDIIKRINTEEKTSILLVEQNAKAALELADYGYVMENGRVVMDGPAEKLRDNEDIKEFYLGLSKLGQRRSYKEVKHYKRRKRWLA